MIVNQEARTCLVLGGARSGKSRHAQALAEARSGELVFIATGQAFDEEMRDRIARHRADRGPRWRTVEAPTRLAEAIGAEAAPGRVLLVDCLTLWTSNLLLADEPLDPALSRLEAAIRSATGALILVSNEVGWGIVPEHPLARRFRDLAGTVNQRVAAAADRVDLVVAGLPLRLK